MRNVEQIAKEQVALCYELMYGKEAKVTADRVFVVWQCKTLQNWKAILGAPTTYGLLFEATYNGDKDELYFDVYKKLFNNTLPADELDLLENHMKGDEEKV